MATVELKSRNIRIVVYKGIISRRNLKKVFSTEDTIVDHTQKTVRGNKI